MMGKEKLHEKTEIKAKNDTVLAAQKIAFNKEDNGTSHANQEVYNDAISGQVQKRTALENMGLSMFQLHSRQLYPKVTHSLDKIVSNCHTLVQECIGDPY